MRLEYHVKRQQAKQTKTQTMSQLLDFESSLVLAQTTAGDKETERHIDMFTSQFKWMRDINETCFRLHEAGHFSFTSGYRLAVPILGKMKRATAPLHCTVYWHG